MSIESNPQEILPQMAAGELENIKTIVDIISPQVLDALGYVPGRIQGSFMFFPEDRPGKLGLAHVFDATESRPNIVVIEKPANEGAYESKEWYANFVDGPAYKDLNPEDRKLFIEKIMGVIDDSNRFTEQGLAITLSAVVGEFDLHKAE